MAPTLSCDEVASSPIIDAEGNMPTDDSPSTEVVADSQESDFETDAESQDSEEMMLVRLHQRLIRTSSTGSSGLGSHGHQFVTSDVTQSCILASSSSMEVPLSLETDNLNNFSGDQGVMAVTKEDAEETKIDINVNEKGDFEQQEKFVSSDRPLLLKDIPKNLSETFECCSNSMGSNSLPNVGNVEYKGNDGDGSTTSSDTNRMLRNSTKSSRRKMSAFYTSESLKEKDVSKRILALRIAVAIGAFLVITLAILIPTVIVTDKNSDVSTVNNETLNGNMDFGAEGGEKPEKNVTTHDKPKTTESPTSSPTLAPSTPAEVEDVDVVNLASYAEAVLDVLRTNGGGEIFPTKDDNSIDYSSLEYIAYEWLVANYSAIDNNATRSNDAPTYMEILLQDFISTGSDTIANKEIVTKIVQRYTLAVMELSMRQTSRVTTSPDQPETSVATHDDSTSSSTTSNSSDTTGSAVAYDPTSTSDNVTDSVSNVIDLIDNFSTGSASVPQGAHDGTRHFRRQLLRGRVSRSVTETSGLGYVEPRALSMLQFANAYVDECYWYGVICPNVTTGGNETDNGSSSGSTTDVSDTNTTTEMSQYVSKIVWADSGFTGTIPSVIRNLKEKLTYIDFGENRLHGPLPEVIVSGEMTKLEHIYLHSNEFTGMIPTTIGLLEHLQSLFLFSNRLHGPIPSEIGSKMDNNRTRPLRYLNLFNNSLTGQLPTDIHLPRLFSLDVGYNQLTGPIPDEWMSGQASLRAVRTFFVDHNQLSGPLPSTFPYLGSGRVFDVRLNDNTNLTGSFSFDVKYETLNLFNSLEIQNTDIQGVAEEVCRMSVLEEGEMILLSANCGACNCQILCSDCFNR